MTLDPYRTLGLEAGASAAEVKRAYRRLAKAFHPDSAGEAALPRFLAIHEAYEAIRTGRPTGATRAGERAPGGPAATPTAEPWRADPARARAARERARTGRARAAGAGTRAGQERARSSGSTGSGGGGATGTAGSSERAGGRGRRGGTRKATLGSTSYDEARDPADASWSGASWYGPTTGEYWIINPREYADPRKHGPEYQSRARRMAADPNVSGTIEDEPPFVSAPVDEGDGEADSTAGWTGAGSAGRDDARRRQAFETRAAAADPGRGRSRAQRAAHAAEAARATAAAHAARPAATARARPATPTATGDLTWDAARIREARRGTGDRAAIGESARDWLGGAADDPIRRLGSALVAWPPIGLAAAAAIGDVTGCTTYSAACEGTDPLLPWLAQAGILGLLLLLPALARLLAGGTVAIVMALVPVTAFLLVVGGSGEPEAGFALAFLLAVAWLVGVAGSIVATTRRRVTDHAGGPL